MKTGKTTTKFYLLLFFFLVFRAFVPDLQARRRKAKANESAALEPTLAKPSTPLLTGRELGKQRLEISPKHNDFKVNTVFKGV